MDWAYFEYSGGNGGIKLVRFMITSNQDSYVDVHKVRSLLLYQVTTFTVFICIFNIYNIILLLYIEDVLS